MIVYFLEANKIYTFKLPLEVSGNYILSDYDSSGNKRSLVSVSARDGKWIIKDNDEVKIYYNQVYNSEVELKLYTFYQLIVYGTESILTYVAPVYDPSFTCRSVLENSIITFGKEGCDINFPVLGSKQLELSYVNGSFTLRNLNPSIPVYVNNTRKDQAILDNFDKIFLMGLKILVLGSNIYINSPNGLAVIMSNKFNNPIYKLAVENYKANADFYKDFYEEKDYFFKTPVFQNALEELEMTIAPPPDKYKNQHDPLFLTIVPSIVMSASSLIMGYNAFLNMNNKNQNFQDNIMTLIMSVGMLISGILWPFVERFYEKFIELNNERRRVKKYTKYLNSKEEIFKNTVNIQKATLIGRYLSLTECKDAITNKNPNLFSRNYDGDYFLSVRLGIGQVPLYSKINFQPTEYSEEKDKLRDKVEELINKYKYLDQAPYYLSLYEKNITAFIGPNELKSNYMNAILLQLIAYHSFTELKIVILSDNAKTTSLNYLKNSNYCWNEEKDFRYFADSYDDGQIISDYLEKELVKRKNAKKDNTEITKNKKNLPYYLILSDNISIYRNLKIINDILDYKENQGFGILMFDSKVTNIPDGCENFINYTEKEGYYFRTEMAANNIQKFTPEFIGKNYNDINIENCISLICNTPLKIENNESGSLPNSLGFLEMMGVGKIEQLNSAQKWANSNIVNSIATPIGVDANDNLLYLDLHEKKHGPHGLIAGMTGSGKSEFIITYILSLAVNYSPNEVQFVLIDYKGGGLAGAFENRKTGIKLPHLVGTITNLDKSEMKRTLVSVKSELQRRQKMFNEAKEKLNTGTIDIYKYQKLVRDGKLDTPLAHLFIICDEFAELKAQQPDFMDELVSTARIGRSLGVHLILATQKPTGVVDEQIWSNSKFKVCCKVQTAEDSNEMIRKPDAAYIKEAGRFYLQVGYDEYFVKGQSAYTGGGYVPSEKINSKYTTNIDFINDQGEVIKTVSNDSKKENKTTNLGEELTNVLKYLIETAHSINFQYQQMWLDNVPKTIYIDDIRKKYNIEIKPFEINPLIGEYDDPTNQKQGPVRLALNKGGNVYITGIAGSGKTTLLFTIIYSIITTHSVQEVNFYIVDLVAETLKKFSNAPQVGEVLTIGNKEKIVKMFYFLQKELEKRKRHYSTNGGSFENDIKNGNSIFANIIIIINGFDVFKEQFENIYDDFLGSFTRECNRYGIMIIFTGVATSLGYSLENNFSSKIALKLNDPTDYSYLLSSGDIVPNDNPGRGLIELENNVYEFQTSLIFDYDNLDTNLDYITKELNKIMPKKAPKIPTIPNHVTVTSFKNEVIKLSSVPIGIEMKSACPYFYNFDNLINIIVYGKETSIKSFLPATVDLFCHVDNTKNIVLSAYDYLKIDNPEVKYYNSNFKAVLTALRKNISKVLDDATNNNKYIITIFGYSKLNSHLNKQKEENPDEEMVSLDSLILLTKNSDKVRFVIVDHCELLRNVDNYEWYNLVDLKNGIIISAEFDSQELFVSDNDYDNRLITRDDAIVMKNNQKEYIKFINIE